MWGWDAALVGGALAGAATAYAGARADGRGRPAHFGAGRGNGGMYIAMQAKTAHQDSLTLLVGYSSLGNGKTP